MQVLKAFIFGTNTSSQTYTSFTGASYINDCLLQPTLHVSHPLLQFADITDPLVSTAALFRDFIVTSSYLGSLISCKMNS